MHAAPCAGWKRNSSAQKIESNIILTVRFSVTVTFRMASVCTSTTAAMTRSLDSLVSSAQSKRLEALGALPDTENDC